MTRKPIALRNLREAAKTRRSTLYMWLIDNHDTFAAVIAEAGRPNWQALAAEFGAQGYTDADGKPPSVEGARQTWWKVRKTIKARRAAAARKQPSAPTPRASVAAATSPGSPISERQPAPIKPLVVDPVRSVAPVEASAPPRKRVQLRSAQTLAADETPTLDGSTLPRPLHPNLKHED